LRKLDPALELRVVATWPRRRLGCSDRQPKWRCHEKGADAVYVVIRNYSGQGATELFDLLGQREADVRELIGGVPGFVTYAAFRTDEGGATVTVCQDKEGTDESSRRAAAWVQENVTTSVDPPRVTEGSTVIQF
jgi:hypothetical protein